MHNYVLQFFFSSFSLILIRQNRFVLLPIYLSLSRWRNCIGCSCTAYVVSPVNLHSRAGGAWPGISEKKPLVSSVDGGSTERDHLFPLGVSLLAVAGRGSSCFMIFRRIQCTRLYAPLTSTSVAMSSRFMTAGMGARAKENQFGPTVLTVFFATNICKVCRV